MVVVTIGTAAHISRHNKHPGIDGVESRDTVAGVNTTSLSECDGHKRRARYCYRSVAMKAPLPRPWFAEPNESGSWRVPPSTCSRSGKAVQVPIFTGFETGDLKHCKAIDLSGYASHKQPPLLQHANDDAPSSVVPAQVTHTRADTYRICKGRHACPSDRGGNQLARAVRCGRSS